jgi:hypothetical protein
MTRLPREQLEEMREDGASQSLRDAFTAAERASNEWERHRGRAQSQLGIEEILDWIDELRAAFGEPDVDRRPWTGDDFRL